MSPDAPGVVRLAAMLLVRWSGLALATGFAIAGQWVEVAVSMLVALAQVATWRSRPPLAWEIATSMTCLVAAISSFLLLYEKIFWWDLPVHAALTGLLAVLSARVLHRASPTTTHVIVTGLLLAVVWELMELAGNRWVDPTVHVTPADTATDLLAALTGTVIAGLLWGRRAVPVRHPGR